jgi:hypothetical protein
MVFVLPYEPRRLANKVYPCLFIQALSETCRKKTLRGSRLVLIMGYYFHNDSLERSITRG